MFGISRVSKHLLTKNFRGRLLLRNTQLIKWHNGSSLIRHNLSSIPLTSTRSSVGKWLLGLTGMTFGAVVLGGATSQVKQHGEMALSQFKFIWYMEYIHRMWGRAIGAVFLLPGVYFWLNGYFSKAMKGRFLAYGTLIGFQGVLGWLMVRSGLKEPKPPVGHKEGEPFSGVPRVDHFWLAAHLSAAAVLFSLFAWGSMVHLAEHPPVKRFKALKTFKMLGHTSKALTFTTLVFGAFVAGLDAGLVYNSWPKMADRWIPSDLIVPQYGHVIGNLLTNPTGVQFTHRYLAYTTVLSSTALWAVVMRAGVAQTGPRIRMAAHLVLAAAWGQSTLGILTLLHYVPVSLGVLHQGGSLVLMTALLWFTNCLRAVPK